MSDTEPAHKKKNKAEGEADTSTSVAAGDGGGGGGGSLPKQLLDKGEAALKRAVGLGSAQPNVVPEGEAVHDGEARAVAVGWHPVGGPAGRWLAERTGLGRLITERTHMYPDPTQHWAVLVGDYAHQLWMDENFHVIYTNEETKRQEWKTFPVGQTRFNDDAIRRTGESVIATIRETGPVYNLISNNCQTYALRLLDAIKVGPRKEFGTTLAVYERMFGPGKVADLFGEDGGEQQQQQQQPVSVPGDALGPEQEQGQEEVQGKEQEGTVGLAQKLMKENTTQLDATEQMKVVERSEASDDDRGGGSDGMREKTAGVKRQMKNLLARFSRDK